MNEVFALNLRASTCLLFLVCFGVLQKKSCVNFREVTFSGNLISLTYQHISLFAPKGRGGGGGRGSRVPFGQLKCTTKTKKQIFKLGFFFWKFRPKVM